MVYIKSKGSSVWALHSGGLQIPLSTASIAAMISWERSLTEASFCLSLSRQFIKKIYHLCTKTSLIAGTGEPTAVHPLKTHERCKPLIFNGFIFCCIFRQPKESLDL